MTKTYQVRVKPGCRHGRLHADYDARRPTGNPGPYALAGEVIEVTQAELDNFGDKFALLDPVSAVLSAGNGTSAPAQDGPTVEQLRSRLAEVEAEKTKAERSAQRARATLKSERKQHLDALAEKSTAGA